MEFTQLEREFSDDTVKYAHITIEMNRELRVAIITLKAPEGVPAGLTLEEAESQGTDFWPLAICRELDDAILHMRTNELEIGTLVFKTEGDAEVVQVYDEFVNKNQHHWLMREITLYWRRTLKRVDLTSRTLFAFVEQGSCFVGVLAELLFAVDRSYMLEDKLEGDNRPAATIMLTDSNFGTYTMSNGISRLETRFLGEPESVEAARKTIDTALDARRCEELHLVTFVIDSLDWEDELRLLLEERCSYSPDSLTGMEANLRFAGPETMETKIFGRLTAWQNWIFQRPNAVGEQGALRLYGTGARANYDLKRV